MKFRPTLSALGLGLIAIAASLSASAEGNAEHGKVLAYTCHGCHGIPNYKNAYPSYSVPKLGGQHAKYLAAALGEYASGDRSHPTMHSHASTLSPQDRADIAAFLQSEPIKPTEVVGTPPPAAQTCVACHGVDGFKTATEDFPVLAGQQADYLLEALQDYKSGKRKNPVMAGVISGVDAKDFPALAQFFSQQHGLCSTDELRKHGKCD
ncbi:MAG TPA: c-type cytochrome [Steroidobacteraceae bacterium]|jgi:cytochrome c553